MKRQLFFLFAAAALTASAAVGGVFFPEGATTLHFAFEGSPNGDRPIIRPPAFYAKEAGFGFVDSPAAIGTSNGVQAPKYFRFDADLPPGNYDVTVRLGSTQAASNTTIRSEAHRAMVFDISTAARANTTTTFTVNVRASADANDKSLNGDGRLTLEFTGDGPSMMKLDVKPNTTAPTLYLLADGFAADHEDLPRAGWGQMLPLFFKPGAIAIANYSGDRQALAAAMPALNKSLKKGDIVLLSPVLAELDAAGMKLVEAAAALVQERQAELIVVTPAPGRDFNAEGQFRNLSSKSAESWINDVANTRHVPQLSFRNDVSNWVDKLGPEPAKALFAWYPANTFPNQPAELRDDAHLSPFGAFEYARLLALAIQKANLPLAAHLYPEIPPSNSDPKKFPPSLSFDYLNK